MADFKQITVSGVSHPVKDEVARQGLAGKQDKLTFDDTPTANSNNPVKSGGVYQAIQDIDVPSQISGKADKSEMSVVAGTGADADKTTITLKNGTSATVLTQHQDISGKEDKSNKVTSFSSPTDTQYPSAKLVSDQLVTKQDVINDLADIRANAGKGATAIQSVTVGTTTTGAAGSSASVTNTGTATEPVLSFTIPQGAQGIQGIQGPQGERGPQGNTGVQVDSVASIIHSIDPTATYAAADVAGADAVQDVLSEVTELAGEVFETKDTTVESPQYEEGFMYTDGRITSTTSYGIVKPIEMLKGDTIILNLGNGIYHGYGAAVLFKCSSDGTFIESLISGSGTSIESWTNNTDNTIYVGICAYKEQTGYIIRRKIALKTSLNKIRDSFGHVDSLSFDVAAGSTTPTTEKMDVDIAAGDIFYLKVSDTIGDGNAYELYFQYDGQSSGTGVGTILSGTAYMYTASQNIDKINIWKRAVSTDKTVRIDVWTGLLGQINSTESNLSTLKITTVKQAILSEAYTIARVTRNTSGNVTAASIVYPDGVTGTMTVTRNSAGAATSVVYTYGTSSYTLTITRDSNNNVTATSLS